jgi:hypothetical protein
MFFLKTITRIEMSYNKWYKLKYGNNNYSIYVNNTLTDKCVVDYNDMCNIYTIEYNYKNKVFRIVGKDLVKLTEYVENVEEKLNEQFTHKTYKWISAIDSEENCYLDEIKKLAGPLGDFYAHAGLNINPNEVDFMVNKKITITDFRLDNFVIDSSEMSKIEIN